MSNAENAVTTNVGTLMREIEAQRTELNQLRAARNWLVEYFPFLAVGGRLEHLPQMKRYNFAVANHKRITGVEAKMDEVREKNNARVRSAQKQNETWCRIEAQRLRDIKEALDEHELRGTGNKDALTAKLHEMERRFRTAKEGREHQIAELLEELPRTIKQFAIWKNKCANYANEVKRAIRRQAEKLEVPPSTKQGEPLANLKAAFDAFLNDNEGEYSTMDLNDEESQRSRAHDGQPSGAGADDMEQGESGGPAVHSYDLFGEGGRMTFG